MARLAAQGPLRPDGSPSPDPAGLLAALGNEAIPRLLGARAPGLPERLWPDPRTDRRLAEALWSPANRIVCRPEDSEGLRAALASPESASPALLHSHLVGDDAAAHLAGGRLLSFLECRRKAILRAERDWLNQFGVPPERVFIEQGSDLYRA